MVEQSVDIGYINSAREHVMITVHSPSLVNVQSPTEMIQVVLTVANARLLRDNLDSFLAAHFYSN